MGQQRKPGGGPPDAGNRAALARIARMISVPDENPLTDETGNDNEIQPNRSAREDAPPQTGLHEPVAAQLLEALPAGLAICEGSHLIRANSAFALAFGFHSPQELEDAGGLNAIFPDGVTPLTEPADGSGSALAKPVEMRARSRSGRKFGVPVAVHPIPAQGDEKPCLLILHPYSTFLGEPADPIETSANEREDLTQLQNANAIAAEPKSVKRSKKHTKTSASSDASHADFLAKVSHEVRTPLNSIIGFSEIMKDEQLGPIGNERYRGYIRDIHDSGLYALSLVNDLLDISKIESGEFALNFAAVNLDEVAAESIHSMQPQAQRRRVLLRTSFADDLPAVLADRRTIKQIILNLVSNAVKFTRPGGQVIVSTQRTRSGGVKLRVRDTGIGMSQGDIAVAMQPFQQLDSSTRREQTGTGLGLPLTKALAEANHAKFKLRSIADAGTRIDVTFPSSRVANAKE